jgi:hypothetical protein
MLADGRLHLTGIAKLAPHLTPGNRDLFSLVRFTANAGLRDKLLRLRALLRSEVPDGDLAAIIEKAVTAQLERLGYMAQIDYGTKALARHWKPARETG